MNSRKQNKARGFLLDAKLSNLNLKIKHKAAAGLLLSKPGEAAFSQRPDVSRRWIGDAQTRKFRNLTSTIYI